MNYLLLGKLSVRSRILVLFAVLPAVILSKQIVRRY